MLTDTKIRTAKPAEKGYRLTDAGGLFLWVTPAGSKIWRLRYEYRGKEKLLTLGPYPAIGLSEAREKREAAKAVMRDGRDPGLARKLQRAAGDLAADNTFQAVAELWHARQAPTWTEHHAKDVMDSLKKYVFPRIGKLPVAEIETPAVVAVLLAIEKNGAPETARRVRQRLSAVFVYAVAMGLAKIDPAHLARAALAPMKKGRQPAITDLAKLQEMMRAVDDHPAHPVTRLAMRLLALTAVRPGELRGAQWPEFVGLDGGSPVWEIPGPRMKMKVPHAVPLSAQAVETIRAVQKLTGSAQFVFPSPRQQHHPMSENALGYALNRAGYHGHHVPHGFRAAFSSIMNENFRADRQVIDLMLAHAPKNEVEGAYNRATHAARRRELAQAWADMLMDGLTAPEELLGLPQR
ncbi:MULTISPECIES: integrase arm-type DNA-binding domain-containing protein [unclassified Acidocella]|uniref:tyrosine-type recombinase/integrase n=1 Tax=unclassified Acidocella TaxID=2648610 RepID=UPI00028C282C|nr:MULTISPECIES: integrase arm-type DNA-binding domain-containing protein [unclassified Acidocella]EKN01080.1 phage integrase [Acidocella sp. MX-AZ02]WBO60595.1 integrase arm-type DNA-binding domain-containing protein [Acidocella sp. MX-AZ03]